MKVQLENLEKANADLAKLGQTATTTGDQLLKAGQTGSKSFEGIASSIQPLQTSFSGAQTSIQKFSQETLQAQQSTFRLTGSLGDTGTAIDGLVSNTGRFQEGMSSATSETSSFTGALSGIGDSMKQLAGDSDQLSTSLSGITADTGGIDNLVSSAEQLTGAFSGAGTEAETFSGGLSSMNDSAQAINGGLSETSTLTDNLATGMGTATTATESLGSSTQSAIGTFTALGGALGTGIGLVFRMNDAQLRLDKANFKVVKSTEAARKAQVAFNSLLEKAPSNINNITSAHDGLNDAMSNLKDLEEAGITSGSEYANAQQAVSTATAELRQQFAKGGGDINKFDSALNKVKTTQENVKLATETADKANRGYWETMTQLPFSVASFAGTIIQAGGSMKTFGGLMKAVGTGITGTLVPAIAKAIPLLGKLGGAALIAYTAIEGIQGLIKTSDAWAAAAKKDFPEATTAIDEMLGHFEKFPIAGGMFTGLRAAMQPAFDELKKGGKTSEEAAGSADKLTKSTMEMGNAADSAGMSNERVLGSIAALPGSIHSVAGAWQDVTATMDDTAGATRLMNEQLNQSIDSNALAAQGLLVHRDAALQNEEAISANHLAYAQSVDTLSDFIAVENDAVASSEKMQTALNNELIPLKEEEATLRASIAASEDLVIQRQALENATLTGIDAAKEWIAGLDDAAAKEEAQIGTLQEYASQFGEFPSVIRPTVESLQQFIEANQQGGQAAIDFQQQVLDAYNGLVAGAQPLLDGLTSAFHKSGKEQREAIEAEWDKLLPGVEGVLTGVEKTALTNLANMRAEIERGQQGFAEKLAAGFERGLNLEDATNNARTAFTHFLNDAQEESSSSWDRIWDEAHDIGAHGSADMINAAC